MRIRSKDAGVLALYAGADRLLDGWTCDASTDCCRFVSSGREPYLWPNEWRPVERAMAARGGARGLRRRKLPLVDDEGTCPLLEGGRCSVYAVRPFGCRTFFCERAQGPERRPPRAALAEIGRRIAEAAQAEDPRCDGPRPLSKWLQTLRSTRAGVS